MSDTLSAADRRAMALFGQGPFGELSIKDSDDVFSQVARDMHLKQMKSQYTPDADPYSKMSLQIKLLQQALQGDPTVQAHRTQQESISRDQARHRGYRN